MSQAVFLADAFAKEHDTGPGHPEQIARWDAAVRGLHGRALLDTKSREATLDEMLLCHTPAYLKQVDDDISMGYATLSTGDTDISKHSFEVARRGVGLALNAIDHVLTQREHRAFCVVRPPGHHARPDQGMGFCLLNNIAIAARYAQRNYGLERILIADWDVHHGNGTQDIFYEDGSVFFCSTHQSPWYPGTGDARETGEGLGKETTFNIPLPAGSRREEVLPAYHRLAQMMDSYKPDMVLISAGFDSMAGDPLGKFLLSTADFTELTELLLEVAAKHAQGRVVSLLEGGYSLRGLEQAVHAHALALESGS